MLVFIGKLSLCSLRWVPIYQVFGYFLTFLHYFVLTKLATSSQRVNLPQVFVWEACLSQRQGVLADLIEVGENVCRIADLIPLNSIPRNGE